MILQVFKLEETMKLLDSQKKVSLTETKNRASMKRNHLIEQKILIKLPKDHFGLLFETHI